MNNVKIYKCFIASPSDTKEERKICDSIFTEINKTLGEKFHFRVESVKWESDATPDFSSEPQQVINDKLFKDINIFIGIMYQRFGTPTKNYGSGTEEEFYKAHDMYEKSPDNINIKMYFNDAPINPSKIDHAQSQKVAEFKEIVSSLGGVYAIYKDTNDFKDKLKHDLVNHFLEIYKQPNQPKTNLLEQNLKNNLNDALISYTGQKVIWVDRVLCKTKHVEKSFKEGVKIEISTLIKKPYSLILETPSQFGLTCLAYHLVLEAWKQNSVWIYLDANKIYQNDVDKSIKRECTRFSCDASSIDCIILDSWVRSGNGMMKILKNLCHSFQKTPVFIMSTRDVNYSNVQDIKIKRTFEKISMLPLTKNNIRTIVSKYSEEIKQEEDVILNKIVSDLDNLNIHRTPAHCLTLLRISERYFDESPVNRAKMISMFLSVLFDFSERPDYSKKPDMEHCEFLLGFLCENMIRNEVYSFSKNEFIENSQDAIKKQKLSLDVQIVFDILYNNHIIIQAGSNFKFKQTFWIYYFAAKRMNVDDDFCKYILANKKYISFIEIIEFYTGINRGQNDLIDLLTDDLQKQCKFVEEKVDLANDFDPLTTLQWNPSDENLEKTYEAVQKEVLSSNLPDAVKDRYADSSYKIDKPDNQNIYNIYQEDSLLVLKQQIHVCSRALRNSDFINPDSKINLLDQITKSWNLFSKILFAMSPILASEGNAGLDGFGFYLGPYLNDMSPEKKLMIIIRENPSNIVQLFQEDLYSERLSPVFYENFNSEKNSLIRHQLILFLIKNKPAEWQKYIEEYVKSISQKSTHLLNVINCLIHTYQYDYANIRQIADTRNLIELCFTRKKIKGTKNLKDVTKSMSSKFRLPKRLFKDE